MKIGILTFHRANNYGAVLQAYALNRILNNLGFDAYEIDYCPSKFRAMYYFEPHGKKLSKTYISKKIRKVQLKKVLSERNSGFEKFVNDNFKMSPAIDKEQLYDGKNDLLNDFEAFITGSDQVWNDTCADFDAAYFLDFPAAKKTGRYSFAASFNFEFIPDDLKIEYAKRLTGYNSYSVREEKGIELIKELVGQNALLSCDPTFLIGKETWEILAEKSSIIEKIGDEPFVLVYYVKLSRMLMEYAKRLSTIKKMRVVCVPCNTGYRVLSGKQYSEYGFSFLPAASPYDFLELYQKAAYVLSNSFHGTVFSIIFKKQFFSILQSDKGVLNTRSFDLLKRFGLINRILTADTKLESIDDPIDYYEVEKIISSEKETAISYLKEMGK